jgi:hypothetical protein
VNEGHAQRVQIFTRGISSLLELNTFCFKLTIGEEIYEGNKERN